MRIRAPFRLTWLSALAACATLGGCATDEAAAPKAWRIEPQYRISSTGDPANARGYYALGNACAGEGRWQEAAQAYARAAMNDPLEADYHSALGISQAMLGHNEAAVSSFKHSLTLAPNRNSLLNNLGYVLLLSNRLDEAVQTLSAALLQDPTQERTRQNLAAAEQARALAQGNGATAASTSAGPASASTPAAAATGEVAALTVLVVPTAAALRLAPPAAAAAAVASAPPPSPSSALPLIERPEADATRTRLSASEPALAPLAHARLEIVNGNGATGAAGRLRQWLNTRGIEGGRLVNLKPFNIRDSKIEYADGFRAQAHRIAQLMQQPPTLVAARTGEDADVRVVIGLDAR